MSARDEADGLIDSHAELFRQYQEQRCRVTNAEVYGLIEPETVEQMEASLTLIYRMLNQQAAGIARLNAELNLCAERETRDNG